MNWSGRVKLSMIVRSGRYWKNKENVIYKAYQMKRFVLNYYHVYTIFISISCSFMHKQEIFLSPLEIARRKRAFNVIHQTYLNESWYDVLFLKNLRTNPSLLLRQCKNSRQFLETLVNKQYDVVRRFIVSIKHKVSKYIINQIQSSL